MVPSPSMPPESDVMATSHLSAGHNSGNVFKHLAQTHNHGKLDIEQHRYLLFNYLLKFLWRAQFKKMCSSTTQRHTTKSSHYWTILASCAIGCAQLFDKCDIFRQLWSVNLFSFTSSSRPSVQEVGGRFQQKFQQNPLKVYFIKISHIRLVVKCICLWSNTVEEEMQ